MILVITPASSLPHFTITTPLVITEASLSDTRRVVPLAIRILSGLTADEVREFAPNERHAFPHLGR